MPLVSNKCLELDYIENAMYHGIDGPSYETPGFSNCVKFLSLNNHGQLMTEPSQNPKNQSFVH